MKKIITILMAVCLMVSLLGVSALAEGEYTGPKTHTLPTLIDFNDETIKRYDDATDNPINFYNMRCRTDVKAYDADDTTDKYLFVDGTSAVNASMGIKFADFTYDTAAADAGNVQPKKLVISVDIDYEATTTAQTTLGGAGVDDDVYTHHIKIGEASADFVLYGQKPAPHTKYVAAWDYTHDTQGNVTGTLYGNSYTLDATAMNNQAHLAKISNGDKVNYTFVIDLTRDDYDRANYYTYIDGVSSGKLNGSANVETVNAISFSGSKSVDFIVDNVRIYTIDNAKIAATGTDLASTTDVPLTTEEVTVNFSHEITAAADSEIIVKKAGTPLIPGRDYTIEHVVSETGAKTAKAFKVKFNEDLSYGTTYTIGGSADYFGIDGYALEEETTFASFTTEAAPQINLSTISVKKGFYGNIDVTDLADALGSSVSVTTTASNGEATGTATGTVFFGVYKNDILVNLAFVKKTFAEGESDEITVNLDLPAASGSDVIEIKAFACEGLGNLDAYGTVQSLSTAN